MHLSKILGDLFHHHSELNFQKYLILIFQKRVDATELELSLNFHFQFQQP
jgi:hypothetical protein